MLARELTKDKWNPSVHTLGKFIVHITGHSQVDTKKKMPDDIALIVRSADPPFDEICRTIVHKDDKYNDIMLAIDRRSIDSEEAVAVMYTYGPDKIPCQMLKLRLSAQKKEKT